MISARHAAEGNVAAWPRPTPTFTVVPSQRSDSQSAEALELERLRIRNRRLEAFVSVLQARLEDQKHR
jgi:hypothetical protein